MFKDVQELISVEMKSDKNCEILSMISTFENCNYLIFNHNSPNASVILFIKVIMVF